MTRSIEHSIVDVLVVRDGKFLLVEESKPGREGRLSVPGGHIEPHETVLEAAVREVKEESGYDVELTNMVGLYQSILPHVNVSGPVLTARVVGGKAGPSDEHPSSKWATLGEVRSLARQDKLFGKHILSAIETYSDGKLLPLDAIVCRKFE